MEEVTFTRVSRRNRARPKTLPIRQAAKFVTSDYGTAHLCRRDPSDARFATDQSLVVYTRKCLLAKVRAKRSDLAFPGSGVDSLNRVRPYSDRAVLSVRTGRAVPSFQNEEKQTMSR